MKTEVIIDSSLVTGDDLEEYFIKEYIKLYFKCNYTEYTLNNYILSQNSDVFFATVEFEGLKKNTNTNENTTSTNKITRTVHKNIQEKTFILKDG